MSSQKKERHQFPKKRKYIPFGRKKIPFVGRQHIAVTEFALNIMLEFIAF